MLEPVTKPLLLEHEVMPTNISAATAKLNTRFKALLLKTNGSRLPVFGLLCREPGSEPQRPNHAQLPNFCQNNQMASKKFRSTSNKVTALLVWIFAFGTIAVNLAATRVSISVMIALIFIAAVAWLLFWRPSVLVDEVGIDVQNPLRKTRLDYADVQAVDGRFGLVLMHNDRRFTVWAVTGRDSAIAREIFHHWQRSRS